ncbi:hypothetical protein [Anaerobium acetethylicum]|uniref:Uncharacterized protein n=1 Tax=Anaerobium acetethylicum TaxID=1619234 RepID=A0A1D3TYF1_9FIRM|nr:hypothetical protein [Anaerobium acetethylicum]SCP99488.1 hypothetical protein SAMN05421730_10439 [Anaerobium acetethylicum]
MKSDREFLDGIYEKVEKAESDQPPKIRKRARYVKYAGMAAGFLVLAFSAMFLNRFTKSDDQNAATPAAYEVRMVDFSEQLIAQASDIVEVEARDDNGGMVVDITRSFKSSGNDLKGLPVADLEAAGLSAGQSAVVFVDADAGGTSVMDVFIGDADHLSYTNQYGETIELERLTGLENEGKKER